MRCFDDYLSWYKLLLETYWRRNLCWAGNTSAHLLTYQLADLRGPLCGSQHQEADAKTKFLGVCELESPRSIRPNSETYRRNPVERNNSCTPLLLESAYFGVIWGSFCIFIMAHSVFSLRHEVENYAIVVHKQGSFLTSSCPINNAEQVSMERSREFRVRHYPVSPSFYGQVGRRPHWGSDLLKDVFVL